MDIDDNEHSPLLDPERQSEKSQSSPEHSTSTVLSIQSPKTPWRSILLGQVASIFICLTGVTSLLLQERGHKIPSAQNFASYLLISLFYSTRLAYRPGDDAENFLQIIVSRGWKYFLITLADVAGNYLVVRAYQFTSLTSVQLLDCFSIPTVLVLSYIVLKARYVHFHYLGVFLSLLGISCLIWADIMSGRTSEGSSPVIGDFLVLSGAFLYGVSNVAQEFFVKNFHPDEFLGLVGFFGSFIAGVQTLLLEDDLSSAPWTWDTVILLLAFALSQFIFYSIVARLLVQSSSVALNLSILSADFYSLLVGVFFFQYNFNVLYFVSFMLVIGGVGMFSLRPTVQNQSLLNLRLPHEIPSSSSSTNTNSEAAAIPSAIINS